MNLPTLFARPLIIAAVAIAIGGRIHASDGAGFTVLRGDDYTLTLSPTGHFAELQVPASVSDNLDAAKVLMFRPGTQALGRRLYENLSDSFDFLIFVSNLDTRLPGVEYAGIETTASNSVGGTGVRVFNSSSAWGSRGRLQAVMHLPDRSSILNGPSLHELFHRWGNFLSAISGTPYHWGFSGAGGQLGGFSPGTLTSLGGNRYLAYYDTPGRGFGLNSNGGNALPYGELELYLMGLVPPSAVPPIKVARNAAMVPSGLRGEFTADAISTVTVEDIIRIDGPRVPDVTTSQKDFRTLFVVVTKAPLTSERRAVFEADIEQFTRAGDDNDTFLYNFWEATRGLATLSSGGLSQEILPFPAGGDFKPSPPKLKGKKKIRTGRSNVVVRGRVKTFPPGTRVQAQSSRSRAKMAALRPTGKFKVRMRLKRGKNVIKVRSITPLGTRSKKVRLIVRRR